MACHTDTVQLEIKKRLERGWSWITNNLDVVVGWLIVLLCCGAVLKAFPWHDIFSDTTATGGDTGAHVWWPAYLRDHLLPKWRVAGWSPDWYGGFPAGQFYFPLPALMTVLLNVFMPYNVAFKIVTVIGAVGLPWAAYVFGRGIRAARPTPELFAVAMVLLEYFRGDPSGEGAHQAVQFNQRIMGITLASTLAGTYSFTIAVFFALMFLGTFARALDQRRRLALPAILLACCVLSHLVVALFAVVGAVLIFAFRMIGDDDKLYGPIVGLTMLAGFFVTLLTRNPYAAAISMLAILAVTFVYLYVPLKRKISLATESIWKTMWPRTSVFVVGAAVLVVGALLTAFWSLPLKAFYAETASMRYEKIGDDPNFPGNEIWNLYLFPSYLRWIWIAAIISILIGVIFTRRSTLIIFAFTVSFALIFYVWPEGKAWNLRYLPFYYLGLFFLAACGFGELCRLPGAIYRWVVAEKASKTAKKDAAFVEADLSDHEQLPKPATKLDPQLERQLGFTTRAIATGMALLLALFALYRTTQQYQFPWGGGLIPHSDDGKKYRGFVDGWANWNYAGYEDEGTPTQPGKSYAEYKEIIQEMDDLPPGRAVWEKATDGNSDTLNAYGTDFALMILPYWTDGRIDSMEGLYFESAGTTPYHFLMVAKLARNPSNVVRGYPYKTLDDFDEGVTQMQMLGVNYYMAQSSEAKEKADENPDLELLKEIPDRDGKPPSGWSIYRVKDAPLVEGLQYEPVVVTDLKPGRQSTCFDSELAPGVRDPKLGPWECVAAPWWEDPLDWEHPISEGGPKSWKRMKASDARDVAEISDREQDSVRVSKTRSDDDSISFDVSRTGVPVVVKTSYYPAWEAKGAEGPWRLTPNLMVVVPTEKHVELQFERTTEEKLGIVLSLLGVFGAVALAVVPRRYARRAKKKNISA